MLERPAKHVLALGAVLVAIDTDHAHIRSRGVTEAFDTGHPPESRDIFGLLVRSWDHKPLRNDLCNCKRLQCTVGTYRT